jgi:hypothetical protein
MGATEVQAIQTPRTVCGSRPAAGIKTDSDEARYVAATTASGLQRPESIMSSESSVTGESPPHLTDFMVRSLLRNVEKIT